MDKTLHLQRNKKDSIPVFLSFLLCCAGFLAGFLFFFAVRNDFDGDIGHFARGSILFGGFVGVCVALLILCVGFSLIARRRAAPCVGERAPAGTLRRVSSLCVALASIALFISNLFSLFAAESVRFAALAQTIALPGAAAFFAMESSEKYRKSKAHTISGCLACLSVNFMLFDGYFDFTLPLNSPIRNAITVMESALLLFLLSRTRSSLDKNTPAFSALAVALAASVMGATALGLTLTVVLTPTAVPAGIPLVACVVCVLTAVYAAVLLADDGAGKRREKN